MRSAGIILVKGDLNGIACARDLPEKKSEKLTVKNEVYNELPGCCKYDRTEEKKEQSHEGHQY